MFLLGLLTLQRRSFIGQTFSLRQLGICEPPARRGLALCPETGLSHPLSSYSRGPVATENHEPVSPERTMTLWGKGAMSGQNSCLSSRSNSALTLTDTEMDNKSDNEMGEYGTLAFLLSSSVYLRAVHAFIALQKLEITMEEKAGWIMEGVGDKALIGGSKWEPDWWGWCLERRLQLPPVGSKT